MFQRVGWWRRRRERRGRRRRRSTVKNGGRWGRERGALRAADPSALRRMRNCSRPWMV
jgi:hypothetical protein